MPPIKKKRIQLLLGDCILLLGTLADNLIDAIVTDPPYGLSFMNKKWDYDVPTVATWEKCLRVLKPGACALVACGTRTQHRMTVNLEDAGFEIRDIIAWVYGSGFPKSLNIGKQIDKDAGAERETIKHKARPITSGTMSGSSDTRPWIEKSRKLGFHENSGPVPITEAAKQWDGWGTALKPAMELFTLCRKPLFEKTVAANVLRWGVGGLNIDGCRVGTEEMSVTKSDGVIISQNRAMAAANTGRIDCGTKEGRFPANLIHDGSDEVIELFPGEDCGSAARFFYTAKANKEDRGYGNKHPTVKPTDLMQYLCRLITPPNGIILDPFMGSGSTGEAAKLEGFRFIGIELEEEYFNNAKNRLADIEELQSKVKPDTSWHDEGEEL